MKTEDVKILAVDSSSKTASVGVVHGNKVLCDFFIDAGLTHSQTLVPMIDYSLKCLGMSAGDIDVFSAVNGPGSFVGVRIGVSAINGIATGTNKPSVGVSRLEALAFQFSQSAFFDEEFFISVVCDARKDEIYNANFFVENGEIRRVSKDRIIKKDEIIEILKNTNNKIVFVGDCSETCYSCALEAGADKSSVFAKNISINASSAAFLARKIYVSSINNGLDIQSFKCVPVYLRNP